MRECIALSVTCLSLLPSICTAHQRVMNMVSAETRGGAKRAYRLQHSVALESHGAIGLDESLTL